MSKSIKQLEQELKDKRIKIKQMHIGSKLFSDMELEIRMIDKQLKEMNASVDQWTLPKGNYDSKL